MKWKRSRKQHHSHAAAGKNSDSRKDSEESDDDGIDYDQDYENDKDSDMEENSSAASDENEWIKRLNELFFIFYIYIYMCKKFFKIKKSNKNIFVIAEWKVLFYLNFLIVSWIKYLNCSFFILFFFFFFIL